MKKKKTWEVTSTSFEARAVCLCGGKAIRWDCSKAVKERPDTRTMSLNTKELSGAAGSYEKSSTGWDDLFYNVRLRLSSDSLLCHYTTLKGSIYIRQTVLFGVFVWFLMSQLHSESEY